MSEIADWIGCQQLWYLRRGVDTSRSWSAPRLVREFAGIVLTGKPATNPLPHVRWGDAGIRGEHAAHVTATVAARLVNTAWADAGHSYSGYHSREMEAFETVAADGLAWWWLDIGTRPSPAAWLEVADIASDREGVTHLGVLRVRLRTWPQEPKLDTELRPAALIVHALRIQRAIQEGSAKAGIFDRTPGHHCTRCPDSGCRVRP